MTNILGRRGASVLRSLARTGTWIALDFDGTLAPIVRARGRAAMSPTTRALVTSLASLFPTVVVSGRARADVAARVHGIPLRFVVGNHGAEGGLLDAATGRRIQEEVRAARASLEDALRGLRGVEIEDKRYSLSVHDRNAADPEAARAAIAAAVSLLGAALRAEPGKRVTNVVHVDAPDKGHAVRALHDVHGAERVVFVGDDVTDESVFRLRAQWLVSIRVGRSAGSAAPYYVPTRTHVDQLCSVLVEEMERVTHGSS